MAAEPIASSKALQTLERLLAIPAAALDEALAAACDLTASALDADKVDAFLHDPSRDSLVALGSSHQPLSLLQHKAGLDVLQVANGGRVVHVFVTGETFRAGHVEADGEELRGIRETLKVRSALGVPLEVGAVRRGVLMIASLQAERFTEEDARFAEAIARWVGLIAHRAELVAEIAKSAAETARRAVAEELITILAHDLRNHLSPIGGRLGLLRRRAERDQRSQDLRDVDLALRAVDRLTAMIASLLDVARIDQGVLQIEPQALDLGALVLDVSQVLSTPRRSIVVHVLEDVFACADAGRVRQSLENLLSNALDHSPRDAPVTVTVTKHADDRGEWARIDVRDTGPGIPASILPRIFERFVSGSPQRGLGLGLYLAKSIADAHRGTLSVESSAEKGTCFTLLLPIECDERA